MREVFCDPALIRELAEPGSDVRCGVNLICRPPREVTSLILELQNQLRRTEPDQYYYPPTDLHLTVFEICHSLDWKEAGNIAEAMDSESGVWLKDMRRFELRTPVMGFDEVACALRFEADSLLVSLRACIGERVSNFGIPLKPSYSSASPHITLMRYTCPHTTKPVEWWRLLRRLSFQSRGSEIFACRYQTALL